MYPVFPRIVLVLASGVVFVGEASADTGFRSNERTAARTATSGRRGPVRANFGADTGLWQAQ